MSLKILGLTIAFPHSQNSKPVVYPKKIMSVEIMIVTNRNDVPTSPFRPSWLGCEPQIRMIVGEKMTCH